MRLCSCRSVVPRDASFCPRCGRTPNGRRCRACGGTTTLAASFCDRCGSRDLSEGAAAVPLGCLPRLVAWSLALVALRALLAQGLLLRAADRGFEFVFGRSFGSAAGSLVAVCLVVGMYALLLEGMLGDRVPVFRPFVKAVGKLVSLLPRALAWFIRTLLYLVEGVDLPRAKKTPPRKADEEAKG